MGREENMDTSSCSGGEGGGRSKNVKQKKVPQRGLGVAQLEKIRLEEQHENDAALIAANLLAKSIVSPSSNSIPLAPPSPNDLPSPNSSYNLSLSIPFIEFLHPNSDQFSKPLIVSGGEIDLEHGSWPRLLNGEYNLEGRDLHRFTIRPHTNFPYELNPSGVLPLSSAQQRVRQFQPPTSSSMVNASSRISSSSVLNFQMEPPSNQSYLGNNYRLFWPEEEKIVGIKRSYPFSTETPPAPSFQGKFHPNHLIAISGSDQSGSCSNGCTTQMEPSIRKCSREGPSTPSPLPERNPNKVTRENKGLNGDFLTLAPPAASSPLSSRHKHPFAHSGHHEQELSDLEYIQSQGSAKDPERRLTQQPPFTFFPSKLQIGQGSSCFDYANGEKQETIDLDLKL